MVSLRAQLLLLALVKRQLQREAQLGTHERAKVSPSGLGFHRADDAAIPKP